MDDRAAKAERARKQLRRHREAQRLKRESRILEGGGTPAAPEPAPTVSETHTPAEPAPATPEPPPAAPATTEPPAAPTSTESATFASELWSQGPHNAVTTDYDAFLAPAGDRDKEPAHEPEAAPVTDLFAPAATDEPADALYSGPEKDTYAQAPTSDLFAEPPRAPPTRFMEHLFAPSPQRPTDTSNYAATMEASMDEERGADTSQLEAASLFPMESQEPAQEVHGFQPLYEVPAHGDPAYHGESSEAPYYGHDEAYYGHDEAYYGHDEAYYGHDEAYYGHNTWGYEEDPAYAAQAESAPLEETEFYPPYGSDLAKAGTNTFDPEQMLETMSGPVDDLGDSRTLEPIPEHESDESRAEKEDHEAEAPASYEPETPAAPVASEQALPVDDLFASDGTEPWTGAASSSAAESVPPDAFALEAPPGPQQDHAPALEQREGPVEATEVPTVPDTAADVEVQRAPEPEASPAAAIDADASAGPEVERLAADLAEARAQLEALRTECKALAGAKEALEAQLDTQRSELAQCRDELAAAREQRLASERTNADRMTKLQREHREALQALQAEHRAALDAMTPSADAAPAPHALQERRVSALLRAHKRSATTSSSSRMSLAEAETGDFLPRRQPSEKPRMRRDAALTPSQAHHRQASLQMLRARMSSDAEEVAGPAPPTSTLSIVQDEHRVASTVQDQVEMARTHSHQFSQDALLFCSSCQGDLIIV